MRQVLGLYAFAALIFLAIDLVWLGMVARGIYQAEIGPLMKKDFNLWAALAFYVIYIAGLTFFVLLPSFEAGSPLRALLTGLAFGLVAYGTYDLTNLATIEGFTAKIALIDMLWGGVVTGVSSAVAAALALRFL